MTARDAARDARALLLDRHFGVLSTHSVEVPGYPFGSVIPYCLDRAGRPVILISRIAQHTKNIRQNAKCSLIVLEHDASDVQESGRLTLLADAVSLETDEDTAERYYAFFPESRNYHQTHDFDFYRLQPVRIRYIAGFGSIHWLSTDAVLLAKPFSRDAENSMLRHMNEDHRSALRHYCELRRIPVPDGIEPVIVSIDAEGFHLRLAKRIVRFNFSRTVSQVAEVRSELVSMARAGAEAANDSAQQVS